MEQLSTLVRKQKTRLKQVLLDNLEVYLSNFNTLGSLISAPTQDQYWIANGIPLDRIFQNSLQSIGISQGSATTYPRAISGDKSYSLHMVETPMRISFFFLEPAGIEQGIAISLDEQLRPYEVTELIADIYKAAIIETILSQAVDGLIIMEVSLISDFTNQITEQNLGTIGLAAIDIMVKSEGKRPTPTYNTPVRS